MRIAFVPSAPFLLPGFVPPAEVAAACAAAVAFLGPVVTVVGPAEVDGPVTGTVDPTPWGAPGEPASDPLPLPLAVGASLLSRPAALVGVRGSLVLPAGDLLVVGDGTARRTEKAPGHLDPRAEGFDAQVVAAVEAGSPSALLALDPSLGAELLAAGVPVWRAVASVLDGSFDVDVLYVGAPYGVGYVVATWSR